MMRLSLIWLALCLCGAVAEDFISLNVNLAVATQAATTEEPVIDETDGVSTGIDDVINGTQVPAVTGEEDEDDGSLMLRPPDVYAGQLVTCDKEDPNPCNGTELERCVYLQERDARCVCLPGFARGRDGVTCVAVKAFSIRLPVSNPFSPSLYDTASSKYRTMEYNAREALFQATMASDLRNIAEDVEIIGFQRTDGDPGTVIIEANVLISRAYAPELAMVTSDLKEGLMAILLPGAPDDGSFLGNTGLYVAGAEDLNTTVADPDPCVNSLLNYCAVEGGVCTRTSRSFVCSCADGYDDLSPNPLEAPGEVCEAVCNCQNGGECLINERGKRYCRCPALFIGFNCEINGEVLLIVLGCLFGAFLIAAIILCVCCIYKVNVAQSRSRYPEGSVIEEIPRSESDYRGYKVRRPYADPWKYNTYSPSMYYPQYVSYWTNNGQPLSPVPYGGSTYPALTIPRPQTGGTY